jgi:hypothetical protein
MINTKKLKLHIKAAITTGEKKRLMLLLLLGPLRDAVACALAKTGGTDNSRKLGREIGLREEGFAYKRKLERIAFILRDYCIQPVIIAYACRLVRREWNMFSTRWLSL